MKAEDFIDQVKVGGFDQAEYVGIDDARQAVKMAKAEKITPIIKRKGLTMETDAQELAVSLKTYRLRQRLTQAELGVRWGCSRYTIMRIEGAQRVTWEMMYRVFNHLSDALLQEQFGKYEVHNNSRS